MILAVAVLHHLLAEVLAAHHHAGHVDAEHLLEHAHVKVLGGELLVQALGVDQDVHLPHVLHRRGHQRLDALLVGGVHGVPGHVLAASRLDLLHRPAEGLLLPAGNGHPAPASARPWAMA